MLRGSQGRKRRPGHAGLVSPAAVVVSVDDLASLEETLDIAGRPQLMRQIRASLTELTSGEAEVITKDEILRTLSA